MMHCTHDYEWKTARAFRQRYCFDAIPVADPYTWTFNHPNHVHFVFSLGSEIIGYAHIQLCASDAKATMRMLVIDVPMRGQGFDVEFLRLCEKWLSRQGISMACAL
jgi:hypothetical protein